MYKSLFIYLGSMYCDLHLKEAGFNGEKLTSGSVIVVKTHKAKVTWTELTKPAFNNAVCSCMTSGLMRLAQIIVCCVHAILHHCVPSSYIAEFSTHMAMSEFAKYEQFLTYYKNDISLINYMHTHTLIITG